jgi:hypothetical protein
VRRALGLAATVALGATLYAGWTGFQIGPLAWRGVAAVIGGTWLWDLRWPLLPAYVVAVLWLAERVGAMMRDR